MSKVLVVAETVDGQLHDVTRELVTAASVIGDSITLGIPAGNADALAAEAAIEGVDEVATVQLADGAFNHELQHRAVRALIQQTEPQFILMGYTIRSASFAAALAEELNLGFASDVVHLDRSGETGGVTATRPVYGGRVVAELEFPSAAPVLLLARPNVWAAANSAAAPAPVREVALDLSGDTRVRHVDYLPPEGGVDLNRAAVIFSVGRGVGGKENIEAFAEAAEKCGAVLGASRPLVDAGWLPAAHQVGQTGVSVKPELYVAFGISGALQHLSGIQGSKKVVAVNTDQNAPIFNVADVGAIADVNEVVEQLKLLL